MVNQVIQKHRAVKKHAWSFQEYASAERELPFTFKIRVGCGGKVRLRFRGGSGQLGEQMSSGFEDKLRELCRS